MSGRAGEIDGEGIAGRDGASLHADRGNALQLVLAGPPPAARRPPPAARWPLAAGRDIEHDIAGEEMRIIECRCRAGAPGLELLAHVVGQVGGIAAAALETQLAESEAHHCTW